MSLSEERTSSKSYWLCGWRNMTYIRFMKKGYGWREVSGSLEMSESTGTGLLTMKWSSTSFGSDRFQGIGAKLSF